MNSKTVNMVYMVHSVLDILFPPRCAFCGKLLEHTGTGVCKKCKRNLPHQKGGITELGAGIPCVIALYYDDMVKEGIYSLKFGKTAWRANIFGRYIAQTAEKYFAGQFDAVTFVPISRKRNFQRGFDQARLLARSVAKESGVPIVPTLRKIRDNRAQSSLNDPELRRENVKGVYKTLSKARIAGQRFLIVDDVITTGSTITACADTLLAAGAASVMCASLAGGHRPEEPERDGGGTAVQTVWRKEAGQQGENLDKI